MFRFLDANGRSEMCKDCSFETREELFSFCKQLIGPYNRFKNYDDFFKQIRCNDNDMYLTEVFAGTSWHFQYKIRPVMIFEDNRVFDIRLFKAELEQTSTNIYKYRGKTHLWGHDFDGYVYKRISGPRYKHYLNEEMEAKEFSSTYGVKPPASGKRWWYWDDEYPYFVTRSWKAQTKSRKQWARHKKTPIGRFNAHTYDPELVGYIED